MWLAYQLLLTVALLLAGPFLLLLRGRHYLPTLRGRAAFYPPAKATGALWIHAVSVGEAAVGATLARHLPPGLPLLVTTITPTGQERARALLGDRAQVVYLPFDLGLAVARFFRRFRPRALVLVEGDYWPLLLARARARGLPIAAVNARVGDRSFRRLRRFPAVGRFLLAPVDRFGAQSGRDAERLTVLGVAPSKIQVTGNLKYDAPPPPPLPALARSLADLAAGRPLLVAGSTMPGEEEAVLEAFTAAGGGDAALLVLAPRHPERWAAVARLVAQTGSPWARRSELPASGRPDVLLLDSLGELARVYELAAATFVGGTLSGTGGHNPLEPARFGRPIAVGPSMENFRDMAAEFDAAEAWQRVLDGPDLGRVWRDWLTNPTAAAALGRRALAIVEANRGALARTLELVAPLVSEAAGAPPAVAAAEPTEEPVAR